MFRYVDIEAIDNVAQRIAHARELPIAEAPSRARVSIRKGDVLFSLVRPYLKNIARVPDDLDGHVASTAFVALRPQPGVSSRFLFYHLIQDSFIRSVPTYGNSPPAARDEEFLDLEIPLAPSKEQERIASKLDELLTDLDAGVAALEGGRENLKRYRAALLKAAVEGRLTETWRAQHPDVEPAENLLERVLIERKNKWEQAQLAKHTKKGQTASRFWKDRYPDPIKPQTALLPKLPRGWAWATIDQLCWRVADADHKMPRAVDRGIPYVSTRDFVGNNQIDFQAAKKIAAADFESLRKKIEPKCGDLLLSRYGTVGEVRWLVGQQPTFLASYSIACLKLSDVNIGAWLNVALRSQLLQKSMLSFTRGVAQPDLGLAHIRELPVPIPPKDEQVVIAAKFARCESVVEAIAEGIEANRL